MKTNLFAMAFAVGAVFCAVVTFASERVERISARARSQYPLSMTCAATTDGKAHTKLEFSFTYGTDKRLVAVRAFEGGAAADGGKEIAAFNLETGEIVWVEADAEHRVTSLPGQQQCKLNEYVSTASALKISADCRAVRDPKVVSNFTDEASFNLAVPDRDDGRGPFIVGGAKSMLGFALGQCTFGF